MVQQQHELYNNTTTRIVQQHNDTDCTTTQQRGLYNNTTTRIVQQHNNTDCTTTQQHGLYNDTTTRIVHQHNDTWYNNRHGLYNNTTTRIVQRHNDTDCTKTQQHGLYNNTTTRIVQRHTDTPKMSPQTRCCSSPGVVHELICPQNVTVRRRMMSREPMVRFRAQKIFLMIKRRPTTLSFGPQIPLLHITDSKTI